MQLPTTDRWSWQTSNMALPLILWVALKHIQNTGGKGEFWKLCFQAWKRCFQASSVLPLIQKEALKVNSHTKGHNCTKPLRASPLGACRRGSNVTNQSGTSVDCGCVCLSTPLLPKAKNSCPQFDDWIKHFKTDYIKYILKQTITNTKREVIINGKLMVIGHTPE